MSHGVPTNIRLKLFHGASTGPRRADSPPGGRGRSRVGPCCTRSRLASALSLPGLTQPRALGIYGASPAPYPGSLFPRRKSAQNAAGDTPDPVLPNRTPAKKPCAATETPRFGWLLVIGATIVSLRLSALGMMGLSYRAKRIDSSIPSKGRQAKLDEQPATD